MRKLVILTVSLLIFSLAKTQTVVSKWSFPTGNQNDPASPYPNMGTASNAGMTFSSSGTSAIILKWGSTGQPDLAAQATGWNAGSGTKYWMVTLNTNNLTGLTLSSKQQSGGLNAGPRDFKAQYKVGAGDWKDVPGASITVLNEWITGVLNNVALPAECDNVNSLSIKWVMTSNTNNTGGTVASNGVTKIDDIIISGTYIGTTTYTGTTTFSSNYTLNGASTFVNVTINSGVTVTLNSAQSISGTLLCNGTLNTGGNLTLLSTSSSTAVISGQGTGTINGNVTVQRYITGNSAYSYISSPISNANSSVLGTPDKLYYFVNPTGWVDVNNTSFTLDVAKGYAVRYTDTPTINFTGTVNTGNLSATVAEGVFTQTLVYPPYSVYTLTNFNLIGNPYPSAIRVSDFLTTNAAKLLSGAVWFWDDDNSNGSGYNQSDYASINAIGFVNGSGSHPTKFSGVDYIPSGQGFFVQSNNGVTDIDFNNAMRSTTNNVFAKGNDDVQRIYMNIKGADKLYNEVLVAFKSDATYGEDLLYDCPKMKGNTNIAFYTMLDGKAYSIQALPAPVQKCSLCLGVEVAQAGSYSFNIESMENIMANTTIILEDKELSTFIDLKKQGTYSFSITDAGVYDGRFVLHFNVESSGINVMKKDNNQIQAYYSGQNLIINTNFASIAGLININGQEVFKNFTVKAGFNTIHLNVPAGIYMLSLLNESGIINKKIFISGF